MTPAALRQHRVPGSLGWGAGLSGGGRSGWPREVMVTSLEGLGNTASSRLSLQGVYVVCAEGIPFWGSVDSGPDVSSVSGDHDSGVSRDTLRVSSDRSCPKPRKCRFKKSRKKRTKGSSGGSAVSGTSLGRTRPAAGPQALPCPPPRGRSRSAAGAALRGRGMPSTGKERRLWDAVCGDRGPGVASPPKAAREKGRVRQEPPLSD